MKNEMSFRALVVLLAGCSCAQAADPTPIWSGGADLRLREVSIENANALQESNASAERLFQRYRLRGWGQYAPADGVKFDARLTWEGRHYQKPEIAAFEKWYSGALLFDNLSMTLDKPGGLPLAMKLGRQDIFLGNGWLVADGTPIDGSRTSYLDALRTTWTYSPATKVEAILINQDAKTSLTLNNKTEDQTEQDEKGLILYLRNKYSADTDLDAFFFHKANSPVTGSLAGGNRTNNGFIIPLAADPSDDGHVNALGGRIETQLNADWKLRAETAAEWGRRNGRDMQAFGFNGRATRQLGGDWKQRMHLGYEFLSGDDPATPRNEAFDPLWGRWPQWSELYGPYSYGAETRTGETTNLSRFNLGWAAKVHPTTEISLDYHAVFADENSKCGAAGFSCGDKFRGHLIAAWARAKFDKHVSGHLLAEYFFPGNYYIAPKGDNAYFLRAELFLTY
jgi:hypothetical protein